MHIRLLVCIVALATACTSGYSSGVSGSKPVSTLSASEAAIACESMSDYLVSTFPRSQTESFNCYVVGLMELTPEGCQAAYNACMVDPPSMPLSIEPFDCTGAMPDMDCNATVSETEACITASVESTKSRLDEVDCSIAGNLPELQRISAEVPPPSECTRLATTCPSFADGEFGG